MGGLAFPKPRPFYVISRLRRLVAILESTTGVVMPARTCITDDMNPDCFHVIHGSKEGLACLARMAQGVRRDMEALKIACEVAGRAASQQKERADRFETALLQEQKRNEDSESCLQGWVSA